jgi:hypothetical protein
MFLWLISQNENGNYDAFDSAVVVAASEEEARLIHPLRRDVCVVDGNGVRFVQQGVNAWGDKDSKGMWSNYWASHPDKVTAVCLGKADDPTPRVVCASFNAG